MNLRNPKVQRNWILILALLAIILMRRCSPAESELTTLRQNVFALNDSIRNYRDKNKDLVFVKGALISENNDLKILNNSLYNEIAVLKGEPLVAIKTKIKIVHDTVKVPVYLDPPIHLSDGTVVRSFNWKLHNEFSKGNYRRLEGSSSVRIDSTNTITVDSMKINKDELGISILTGLAENGDYLEIFVKSKYPGFEPTEMVGSLIDPKKSDILKKYFPQKRWGLGIYGGYGVYFNLRNLNVGTGALLGVGVQYNIIQWNFKKK